MRCLKLVALATIAVALTPEPAWAWGPGMHILVGTEILGALSLLPAAVASLLRQWPHDFLYGCIAADITFGKKYAPIGRNCHHWHVGEELYEAAETDRTRACALGYLAHLAGDTIAHNFFLPRRLLTSAHTQAIGHSYWEHRMDVHPGQTYIAAARRLITEFDQDHNDELIDRVLDRAVFSFQTNRRIFRGMIRLADHNTWQAFFDRVLDYSRWDVNDAQMSAWLRFTFDFSIDYLMSRGRSVPAALDPTGEDSLARAKKLTRKTGLLKVRQQEKLEELASESFPPPEELGWWGQRLAAEGLWIDLVHLTAKPIEHGAERFTI